MFLSLPRAVIQTLTTEGYADTHPSHGCAHNDAAHQRLCRGQQSGDTDRRIADIDGYLVADAHDGTDDSHIDSVSICMQHAGFTRYVEPESGLHIYSDTS